MKKRKISLLLNILIIISSGIGLYLTFSSKRFMSSNSLLYYTIQSNIAVLLCSIIFFVYNLIGLNKKNIIIPNVIYLIKYITTVAITLTFIGFTFLLIPEIVVSGNTSYLTSLSNVTLHFISPILVVVSLFISDNELKINKNTNLWGLVGPLYYLIFSLFLSIISRKDLFYGFDGSTSKFPYFFLNYIDNGWFTIGNNLFNFGIFYYIVIVLCLIFIITKLYLKIIGNRKN